MADGHGGYRKPSNPAPVSGPSSMSRRTDGRQGARYMSGGSYGEGQDMMDLQTSAPMSETRTSAPRMQAPTAAPSSAMAPQMVPLSAPTQRPNEPVTAGSPFGPGPGPTITDVSPNDGSLAATLRKLVPYDDSGQMRSFLQLALERGW
jgi:hypothetical protein